MWQRFGAPNGVSVSGTEEEFEHALVCYQQRGKPRILCYFSEALIVPSATVEAAEQLLKVAKFRERVGAVGLSGAYSSDLDFKEKFREHLQQIITREFADRTPPLDRNLLALLEVEKERCKERNVPFLTPNLLFALLGAPTSLVRQIFDQACPDKAEAIVERLRNYAVPSTTLNGFSDIDWYARRDVQEARLQAIGEGKSAIDPRHLLVGFLATDGETRKELQRALGKKAFDRLCQTATSGSRIPAPTPHIRDFFNG